MFGRCSEYNRELQRIVGLRMRSEILVCLLRLLDVEDEAGGKINYRVISIDVYIHSVDSKIRGFYGDALFTIHCRDHTINWQCPTRCDLQLPACIFSVIV